MEQGAASATDKSQVSVWRTVSLKRLSQKFAVCNRGAMNRSKNCGDMGLSLQGLI